MLFCVWLMCIFCEHCGFCPPDLSRFDELLEDADSNLFKKVIADNYCHFLHQLLPPLSSASQNYSLRDRTHQFYTYRTAQDALWIVTFLLGPYLRMFINVLNTFLRGGDRSLKMRRHAPRCVGRLNPTRGSGAKPQPPTVFVNFRLNPSIFSHFSDDVLERYTF